MLRQDDRKIECSNNRFSFIFAKPAEGSRSFCQIAFYGFRHLWRERCQLLQGLVAVQTYPPVIGIIQFLKCRVSNVQGSVSHNRFKISVIKTVPLNVTQVRVRLYDAIQMFHNDSAIMSLVHLMRPVWITCYLLEVLAQVEFDTRFSRDSCQQIGVKQWRRFAR